MMLGSNYLKVRRKKALLLIRFDVDLNLRNNGCEYNWTNTAKFKHASYGLDFRALNSKYHVHVPFVYSVKVIPTYQTSPRFQK